MNPILTKRQSMSSPIASADLSASKRGRYDAPCRVLHIGGVPDGCDESEIMQMLLQMGVRAPERIVLPPGKVMAFVQFQLQADADHAVAVFREGKIPCLLRGRRVNFNYSGRDDLGSPKAAAAAAPPSKVLVVSIANVQYPITIDVIQQVFGHFGPIEKVCIIVKPAAATALVQYSSVPDAINARQNLDGKCIYMHCCQMQIVFSDRGDVIIKRFDILQWDYTDPASSHHLAQYVAPFPQCIFVTSTQVCAQPARLPADSLCRFKYAWRPQFHCASASCRHVLPRVASNAAHDGDGNAVLLLPPIQSAGPFCCWPLFPPNVWPHARPHVTHW